MTAADIQGRRCTVTGGAGFIGSNLVRFLLRSGARVTVLDDFSVGRRDHLPSSDALEVIEADIVSFDGLPELIARSDYVFHTAAQVGNIKSLERTRRDAEVNILGSVALLEACRGSGIRRLVYSSSSAIFGEAVALPIDEFHPRRPESFYALSKLTAESYALLSASLWRVPAVCLRYFNVYGLPMENNEYTGVISIFFRNLLEGRPHTIFGDGEQVRDFVFVEDVARANMLAALSGEIGSVYNIGTGCATSILQLAIAMSETAGTAPRIDHAPHRAGEVHRSVADISRARSALGFQPEYDLRRGLLEMWRSLSRDPKRRS